MSTRYVHRASETVLVHPGEYYPGFFEPSALKLSESEHFIREASLDVMRHDIDDIRLLVRYEMLVTDKINRSDHEVSILLQDRGCKRFTHLKTMSLKSIHEKEGKILKLTDSLPGNLSIGHYQIQLALHANGTTEILARKTFNLRVLSNALKFPHIWVEPEKFSEVDLPVETPYHLKWERQDMGSHVGDMVVLWLNKKYEKSLKILDRPGRDELFKKSMTASLLAQIMYVVLTRDEVEQAAEDDENYLAAQLVLKKIKSKTGITREEVFKKVGRGEVAGLSFLSSLAMTMVGMHKKMESKP